MKTNKKAIGTLVIVTAAVGILLAGCLQQTDDERDEQMDDGMDDQMDNGMDDQMDDGMDDQMDDQMDDGMDDGRMEGDSQESPFPAILTVGSLIGFLAFVRWSGR